MKAKVICLRPKHDFDRAGIEMPASFDIRFYPKADEKQLAEVCADVDVILTSSTYPPITASIITRARSLKLIQLTGSGYNTVDLAAADKAGIPVARTPGQNSRSVAQFAFVLMSVLSRGILEADAETKKGKFEEVREKIRKEGAYELEGRVLGILGVGPLGKEMAKIGAFFGADLYYFDIIRLSPEQEKELKLRYADFETLLKISDILTLHIPLTKETRNFIGSKELGLMKPTAILINTSRGGIVDEEALLDALTSNRLKGAALDAHELEPIPRGHPFLSLDSELQKRLILTPHIGGATRQAHSRMYQESINNIMRVLRGEQPEYVVNMKQPR
ncbi:MAG: 2-hydroxyacid dehydrogenase [Deltaproteobacteria bacterium]